MAMVRDRPLAFLLGVILAATALALPLALTSLGWAARPVLAQVRPAPEVSVFIATRATARDVEALKERLARAPGVIGVTLRPKDVALAELARRSGFATTGLDLASNPLPDVLIARLRATAAPEAIDRVAAAAREWPLVDAVRHDLEWFRKVRAIGRVAITGIALFGGLVVVLIGLILVGTVRLHAGTRADEVAVLDLVGATPRFIVRPYAYSAVLTLLVASALAAAVVYGAHRLLRPPLAELTALYGAPFSLPDPEPVHLAAVIAVSVVFGWLVGVVGARAVLPGR
jgi:cell division transport system permease protein